MKFCRSQKHLNMLYVRVEEHGTGELADQIIACMERVFTDEVGNFIGIVDYPNKLIIKDHDYLRKTAAFSKQYAQRFEAAYHIGITGIRKIQFKMYTALAGSRVKRRLFDRTSDAEKALGVNFDRDFEIIVDWQAETSIFDRS